MATLGDALRQHRRSAGMTQEELAELSGVSVRAIGSLENGQRRHPYRETLVRLAEGLDLTTGQLDALVALARRKTDAPTRAAVPHELPARLADFTGRETELTRVIESLRRHRDRVPVVACVGMGGTGKTMLAVEAAHAIAHEFPGGQVFVDLQGYSPDRRLSLEQARDAVVQSLGVQPISGERATAQYRTLLSGAQVLLVLDNLDDPTLLSDLVPPGAGSAVLVTTRNTTVLADGLQVDVGSLSESCARELLRSIVGAERCDADPEAVADVVRLCGHVPLAIRVAGTRLARRPQWPVRHLAGLLADRRRRLDELTFGHIGVRASLDLSVDRLDTGAEIRTYLTLGILDMPDVTPDVVAAATGLSLTRTEQVLERLVDLSLLVAPQPSMFWMHDLVRDHARLVASTRIDDDARAQVEARVLDLILDIAWGLEGRSHAVAGWGRAWLVPSHDQLRGAEARAWLDRHRSLALRMCRRAAAQAPRHDLRLLRLAVGLNQYYRETVHLAEWREVLGLGLSTEAASRDPGARTVLCNSRTVLAIENDDDTSDAAAMVAAAEESGESQYLVIAYQTMADVCISRLDPAGARTWAEKAVEATAHLPPEAASRAIMTRGHVHGFLGDHAREQADYDRALALHERARGFDTSYVLMYSNMGELKRLTHRLEEALVDLHRARELSRSAGLVSSEVSCLGNIAFTEVELGRVDAAVEHIGEAVALARTSGSAELVERHELQRAQVLRSAGRLAESDVLLDRLQGQALARGDVDEVARIERLLTQV